MAFRIVGVPPRQKSDGPRKARRSPPPRGRILDPEHLRLVRLLPCLISGAAPALEAAHVRFACATFGKPITGIGIKPDDRWAVPLCAWYHTLSTGAQHRHGEEGWWADHGINPLVVASALHEVSTAMRAAKCDDAAIVQAMAALVHRARGAAR